LHERGSQYQAVGGPHGSRPGDAPWARGPCTIPLVSARRAGDRHGEPRRHSEDLGLGDQPPGRLRSAHGLGERLGFRRDGRRIRSQVGYLGTREEGAKTWDPATGKVDSVSDDDAHRNSAIPFEIGSRYGENSATSPDGRLVARIIREAQGYNAPRRRGYAGKS